MGSRKRTPSTSFDWTISRQQLSKLGPASSNGVPSSLFLAYKFPTQAPRVTPIRKRIHSNGSAETAWAALAHSAPAKEVMLRTHGVVEIAAKLWIIQEDDEEDDEEREAKIFARIFLLKVLSSKKGDVGVADRIATAGDVTTIAKTALDRLTNATKSPQFVTEWYYCIEILIFIIRFCATPRPEILEAFLAEGAVAVFVKFLIRIASLANEHYPDHVDRAPNFKCLLLYPVMFLHECLEATDGFKPIVQALDAGLLTAFVECSPLYAELEDGEYAVISTIITKIIPKYLAYIVVLQKVETTLKGLERTERFCSLRRTRAWEDFKTFARLTGERTLVMEFSRTKQKSSAICNNLQCTKRDVRNNFRKCAGCGNMLYCSKECQITHWKEAHKKSCASKVDKTLREEIPLLPPRDLHYMQTLNIRVAQKSLLELKALAATEFPLTPLDDLMVFIDYSVVPPTFSLVVRSEWNKKAPGVFSWPKNLFRPELEPETWTIITGVIAHGTGTKLAMGAVSGNLWSFPHPKTRDEKDRMDVEAEARMREYCGL
ncbi:hypothetical protein BDN72DRAFT_861320 [Pluteus cervinus]|uniref:Uncharacterized protein n=1 Tax=Pluteus cervinus TaxID=181527 RepID=A0ACD3AFQ1_9AGAR|nr:hypothetical protein BDN72DRAFT_861320 [Pluteus cervinus]